MDETTVPVMWRNAINKILKVDKPASVVVFGPVDSGKTFFCNLLANEAFNRSFKTAVVDGDIGQSEIGPPTTIGLGYLDKPVSRLSEVPLVEAYFVGDTSPRGLIHRVVSGLVKAVGKALSDGCEVVIVNTCGWVVGKEARELKLSVALSLKPSVIVLIERQYELEYIAKAVKNLYKHTIVRIPPPLQIKRRTLEERKMLRELRYSTFFKESRTRTFSMDSVNIIGTFLGTGIPLKDEKVKRAEEIINARIVYAEEGPEFLILMTNDPLQLREDMLDALRREFDKEHVVVRHKNSVKGIIVGLLDAEGSLAGIGILSDINFRERTLHIVTSTSTGSVRALFFGRLKLDTDGRELGRERELVL